jgi:hypothetical protein
MNILVNQVFNTYSGAYRDEDVRQPANGHHGGNVGGVQELASRAIWTDPGSLPETAGLARAVGLCESGQPAASDLHRGEVFAFCKINTFLCCHCCARRFTLAHLGRAAAVEGRGCRAPDRPKALRAR